MKLISGTVATPAGFTASGMHCGIRRNHAKKDLALVFAQKECDAAAIYTQNKVKGSPLLVTREHLKNGKAQALICNSGNANTCNADGAEKADLMCRYAAKHLNIPEQDVIVASTGVIGQSLPIEPIRDHVKCLAESLSKDGGDSAEEAIMTTDTRKKQAVVEFEIGGKTCRIGSMAKGSGMIHPNMATMLCFYTTDADISSEMLHRALLRTAEKSFNMVSVDGDTSTNDMVTIMASGLAGNPRIEGEGGDFESFCQALDEISVYMAREIARDGEGSSKLLECVVTGAADEKTARTVAKSVICSNLFKAAMFGADANWGRVLCAVGYAPADVDVEKVDVSFESAEGRIDVCKSGMGIPFSEEDAKKILTQGEVDVLVELHSGNAGAKAWGCDLTYDYVKINGDYRT